jgi:NADH-quinone oxidoreductase subunit G
VIAELAKRVGADLRVLTSSMAFSQLVEAVPFYAGLTLEQIGGRGVRWPAREQAGAMPAGSVPAARSTAAREPSPGDGALRLGTFRPIWAAPEVEISPALHYAIARQHVELAPEDARRLGLRSGDRARISQNGTSVSAHVHVRSGVPPGTAFLADGLAEDSANALTAPFIEVRKS